MASSSDPLKLRTRLGQEVFRRKSSKACQARDTVEEIYAASIHSALPNANTYAGTVFISCLRQAIL